MFACAASPRRLPWGEAGKTKIPAPLFPRRCLLSQQTLDQFQVSKIRSSFLRPPVFPLAKPLAVPAPPPSTHFRSQPPPTQACLRQASPLFSSLHPTPTPTPPRALHPPPLARHLQHLGLIKQTWAPFGPAKMIFLHRL